jgi:pyridoxal phosphate enzyme (YggS family)
MAIKDNVQRIKNELPDYVTLVVAVKYATPAQIGELIEAGVEDLGFNSYQQLESVRNLLTDDVKVHFIGHLQSNKVGKVLEPGVYLIQSVDSYRLAERINRISGELGKNQDVLLEVKTDEDNENKNGFALSELEETALRIERDLTHLHIRGLMTVPPENLQEARKHFALMKKSYDGLSQKLGSELVYLSMGMSNDYGQAVEEGANMVRIGRAMFK